MSNVTISSTTSSQEELEHAAGPNWRDVTALPEPKAEPPKQEPETPEGEQPETAAAQEPAEKPESEKEISKGKDSTPQWAKKRFAKLTARVKEAESRVHNSVPKEEVDRLVNERLEQLQQEQATPTLDENDPMVKQLIAKAENAATARAEQAFKEREFARRISEKLPPGLTWEQVNSVASEIRLPASVIDALGQQPNNIKDDMYLHFVENPDVAQKLMDIAPGDNPTATQLNLASLELGKIITSLEKENRSPEASKPKPKPPAPISTVGAASAKSAVPLDELPMREFMKVRNAQEAARRR